MLSKSERELKSTLTIASEIMFSNFLYFGTAPENSVLDIDNDYRRLNGFGFK
jgi:hypothetical protein